MKRSSICILLVISSLLVVSSAAVSAQATYSITVDNGEIDVPERTVNTAGQEFTVTSIAPITPGEEITYQISSEGEEAYRVILYNDERDIEAFNSEGQSTFETDNLDPGTYVVAVDTGEIRAIQPVVITSYETTLSVPAEADTADGATAEISITEHDGVSDTTAETVQAVVANESINKVISAEKTADGEYTADIDSGYEPGEYRVYAVVRSDETVESGQLDVIGMSDEQTLTITDADGDDSESSGGQGGTGSDDGAGSGTSDGDDGTTGGTSDGDDGTTGGTSDGDDDVDNANDSDTGDAGSDDETGTDSDGDGDGGDGDDTADGESDGDDTADGESDGDGTANGDSDGTTDSGATDDSTPGFGVLGTLLAIVLCIASAKTRNR